MYTAQGTIEKSHLLEQHQPMVRRIALQMIAKLPASVELDDLIQAGMIGLLDASSRYEDNQGAQFETFVSQRIRGAMLDELRASDWGSRGLRQSARAVEKAIQALEHRLGRPPSEGEIAKELKMEPGGLPGPAAGDPGLPAAVRRGLRERRVGQPLSRPARAGGAQRRSARATTRWSNCSKADSATSWWTPSRRCPSATSCCSTSTTRKN